MTGELPADASARSTACITWLYDGCAGCASAALRACRSCCAAVASAASCASSRPRGEPEMKLLREAGEVAVAAVPAAEACETLLCGGGERSSSSSALRCSELSARVRWKPAAGW